jgi:hypothetical protein
VYTQQNLKILDLKQTITEQRDLIRNFNPNPKKKSPEEFRIEKILATPKKPLCDFKTKDPFNPFPIEK